MISLVPLNETVNKDPHALGIVFMVVEEGFWLWLFCLLVSWVENSYINQVSTVVLVVGQLCGVLRCGWYC